MPRARSGRMVLLGMLAPLALAIVTLLALCIAGFSVLSAARAYVGGESLWSKARSSAVAHLRAHALNGHASEYRRYVDALAVPLGDRQARLELDKPQPDMRVVNEGLLAGENSAEDIPGLVRLYRWFRHVDFMEEAIATWAEGDRLIEELQQLGTRIHERVEGGAQSAALVPLIVELDTLDERLVGLEKYFSATLGRASRRTEALLVMLTLVLAGLLAAGGALLVRHSMHRQLLDRQLLLDANQRWELGADAAGIGLFDWQVSDDRFDLDTRAAALFGLGEDGPVSIRRAELRSHVHPDDQVFVRQGFDQAVRDGGLFTNRYRVALPGGAVRHLEAIGRMSEASAGDSACMVGVLRDVTAEVAQAQLTMEKEAAERAARLRVEFLSRLSHGLRTPLNAVLGVAQLLAIDPAEPLTPGQEKRVGILQRSGEELLRLVEDVLDITRIETGSLDLDISAVDMLATVRSGLDIVEPERASFGIRIDDRMPHRPAMVKADAQRLQQVFVNLLSNGCRYNSRGGLLTLGFHEEAEQAWITIADGGRGLTPQELAQLFRPFRRLSPPPDVAGTGLGLVVAKLLLERMDGAIAVASEPGRGTAFTVRLPRV